jgi:hypothetical protein
LPRRGGFFATSLSRHGGIAVKSAALTTISKALKIYRKERKEVAKNAKRLITVKVVNSFRMWHSW